MPANKSLQYGGAFVSDSAWLPDDTIDIKDDDIVVFFTGGIDTGTGIVDARNCSNLRTLKLGGAGIAQVLVAGSTEIHYLHVEGAPSVTEIALAGLTKLIEVLLGECGLTESAVDSVLDHLDQAGLENGTVDVSSGDNAPPSAAGLTSKSNLEGKGWTVTVTE